MGAGQAAKSHTRISEAEVGRQEALAVRSLRAPGAVAVNLGGRMSLFSQLVQLYKGPRG